MKSVLISIKPKYCELIASGKKTVEIRKNRPKIDVPFKVYMYQTKRCWIYKILKWLGLYQGKVIGEFVCDEIIRHSTMSLMLGKDKEGILNGTCLTPNEVCLYLKTCPPSCRIDRGKHFYAWHISNLVIYDKPKELSEFYFPPNRYCEKGLCGGCPHDGGADVYGDYDYDCEGKRPLTRPPQSWCYVEEL